MALGNDQTLPQEMQLEVLAFVVRDKVVMSKFSGVLKERHFDSPIHRLIFRIAQAHFSEYKRVPLQRTLQNEIQRVLDTEKSYVPDTYFWSEVAKVYNFTLQEREYTVDRVADFLTRQELIELNRVVRTEISSPERALIAPVSQQFCKLTAMAGGGDVDGTFLFRDLEQMVISKESEARVPTGFKRLDRALGGGLSESELGLVLAPPGRGKSALLIQFGASAVRLAKKVLHVTFELSEKKVRIRYVATLSKIEKDDLYDNQERAKRKLRGIKRVVLPADVHIHEWPSKYCTVDMLRGYILTLQWREEFDPDLVIVDYADLLRAESFQRTGEHRHILGALYESLRGLAMELKKGIWSASQSNRPSLSKPIVSIGDIAESFEKAMVSDVVIAVCRTRRERQVHEGRLFLAKNRDNVDEVTVHFKEDLASNRIWENDNPTISQAEIEEMQERWESGQSE